MILYVINYSLLIVVPLDQWKMEFINWDDWIFTQICVRHCAEHKSTVFSVHFPAKVIVAAKVCCSSCSYYDFCCKTLCFVWYKCWWLLSEASKPCQQQEHALKSKPAIRRALDLSQLGRPSKPLCFWADSSALGPDASATFQSASQHFIIFGSGGSW